MKQICESVCVCLCVFINGSLCTQDALPTLQEVSPAAAAAPVSQYACQRRTSAENNNKIFTVRKLFHLFLDTISLCRKITSALIERLARFTHQHNKTH